MTPVKALAPVWHGAFIAALRETGVVRTACEAVGISRTSAYNVRNADAEFAAKWDEAIQDAADLLEVEALRRARHGVKKPVIYKGQLCGMWVDEGGNVVAEQTPGSTLVPLSVTEYSDTLLIFLLKGIRPEKYRENLQPAGTDAMGELVRDLIRGDIGRGPQTGGPAQQPGGAGGGGSAPDVADPATPRPD